MGRRITITVDEDVWRVIIYAKSQLEVNLERSVSISETINKLIMYLHDYKGLDIDEFIRFIEEKERPT